jgi:hypothetical protein
MRRLPCCLIAMVGLLTAASGGDAGQGRSPAPVAHVDGVYFLGARHSHAPQVFRISGKEFSVRRYDAPTELRGNHVFSPTLLQFRYFDGRSIVHSQVTHGVVNGRLIVGVFRPEKTPDGRKVWVMRCSNPDILGANVEHIATGELTWDPERLSLTRDAIPKIGAKSRTVESLGTLNAPKTSTNSNRFVLMWTEEARNSEVFTGLDQDMGGLGSRWMLAKGVDRLGVVCEEGWSLKLGQQSLQNKITEDELFEKIAGIGHFERVDDIIIAPWSVDLGPVGLIPVMPDQNAATGEWVSADGQTCRVIPPAAAQKPKDTLAVLANTFSIGPPSKEAFRAFMEDLHLRPDDDLQTSSMRADCMMGHNDYPAHLLWFVMADGRLVQYVYSGAHIPAPSIQPVFFRKKATADGSGNTGRSGDAGTRQQSPAGDVLKAAPEE